MGFFENVGRAGVEESVRTLTQDIQTERRAKLADAAALRAEGRNIETHALSTKAAEINIQVAENQMQAAKEDQAKKDKPLLISNLKTVFEYPEQADFAYRLAKQQGLVSGEGDLEFMRTEDVQSVFSSNIGTKEGQAMMSELGLKGSRRELSEAQALVDELQNSSKESGKIVDEKKLKELKQNVALKRKAVETYLENVTVSNRGLEELKAENALELEREKQEGRLELEKLKGTEARETASVKEERPEKIRKRVIDLNKRLSDIKKLISNLKTGVGDPDRLAAAISGKTIDTSDPKEVEAAIRQFETEFRVVTKEIERLETTKLGKTKPLPRPDTIELEEAGISTVGIPPASAAKIKWLPGRLPTGEWAVSDGKRYILIDEETAFEVKALRDFIKKSAKNKTGSVEAVRNAKDRLNEIFNK